jgi:hypothetical protein
MNYLVGIVHPLFSIYGVVFNHPCIYIDNYNLQEIQIFVQILICRAFHVDENMLVNRFIGEFCAMYDFIVGYLSKDNGAHTKFK